MAKKITGYVKLQLAAGKANPAPPVGPALGPHGINIMAFCKEYNARTANRPGEVLPAEITVYADGSFTFVLKTSPTAVLLRKAAKIEKGSAQPNRAKVGKVTRQRNPSALRDDCRREHQFEKVADWCLSCPFNV